MSHTLLHWNFQRTKTTMMTNILPLALLCLLFTGEISYAGVKHIRNALKNFDSIIFSEEDGWVTCQDEDPFSGLTNNKKTEVKLVFYHFLNPCDQLDIPAHLLHETQCIEACRASKSGKEGHSVFDKQEKKCTCVNKDSTWSALTDPNDAPITQSDCHQFRYKVNNLIT